MHDDSTRTDHTISDRCHIVAGGLAEMPHWWDCSCGWESDRGIGHDGFQHARAAAVGHAASYGVSLDDDEMTPDDYVRLGRAIARVMFAAWRAGQVSSAPTSASEAPTPKPKRARRLSPSSIAAWEAQWQAEREQAESDAEAES